jgi:hypothetical protein
MIHNTIRVRLPPPKSLLNLSFPALQGKTSQPAPSAGNDIATAGNSNKSTSAISRTFQPHSNQEKMAFN